MSTLPEVPKVLTPPYAVVNINDALTAAIELEKLSRLMAVEGSKPETVGALERVRDALYAITDDSSAIMLDGDYEKFKQFEKDIRARPFGGYALHFSHLGMAKAIAEIERLQHKINVATAAARLNKPVYAILMK